MQPDDANVEKAFKMCLSLHPCCSTIPCNTAVSKSVLVVSLAQLAAAVIYRQPLNAVEIHC